MWLAAAPSISSVHTVSCPLRIPTTLRRGSAADLLPRILLVPTGIPSTTLASYGFQPAWL
jgi:hypothetical protein